MISPCVFSVPKTSLPMFRSKQFAVKRRFSDFLGLYEKLSEKHSQNGFIVPPPPEKSLIGKHVVFNSAWIFSFVFFLQYTFYLVHKNTSLNCGILRLGKKYFQCFPVNHMRPREIACFDMYSFLGCSRRLCFELSQLCVCV